MLRLTEELLSKEFEKILTSNSIKEFPKFNSVFREVSCFQGIADFVALSGSEVNISNFPLKKDFSIDSASVVLSLLKERSPRSEEFLMRSSGLSSQMLNRVLATFEQSETITITETGGYILGPKYQKPNIELWAFELKLKNWKRAIFQALQYKAFANRVVTVFPNNKTQLLKNNLDMFSTLKIGVMTYDTETGSYEMLVKPCKLKPSSKHHNLFAISRIIEEMSPTQ
jgi:hypothetical protein